MIAVARRATPAVAGIESFCLLLRRSFQLHDRTDPTAATVIEAQSATPDSPRMRSMRIRTSNSPATPLRAPNSRARSEPM